MTANLYSGVLVDAVAPATVPPRTLGPAPARHDAFVAHPRPIPGELRSPVRLAPDLSAEIAGGPQRIAPQHRGFHLAKNQNPPIAHRRQDRPDRRPLVGGN